MTAKKQPSGKHGTLTSRINDFELILKWCTREVGTLKLTASKAKLDSLDANYNWLVERINTHSSRLSTLIDRLNDQLIEDRKWAKKIEDRLMVLETRPTFPFSCPYYSLPTITTSTPVWTYGNTGTTGTTIK
jgi:hypothetical protein